VITHLAFYSGWPNAVSAVAVAHDVFKARGIDFAGLATPARAPLPLPPSDAARAAGVRETVAPMAPALADYTNPRAVRRSVAAARAVGARPQPGDDRGADHFGRYALQLEFHLRRGLENGLKREEIAEAINHLAFYAGWPKAMAAVPVMKASLRGAAGRRVATHGRPMRGRRRWRGRPATSPERSRSTRLSRGSGLRGWAARASLSSRAREATGTATRLGQTLIVTAGRGLVQEEGGPVREIAAGEVVVTAPGVKHWHGAAPDSAMTHFRGVGARRGTACDLDGARHRTTCSTRCASTCT
jgi:4-carboxymuconolactone decarboxylase